MVRGWSEASWLGGGGGGHGLVGVGLSWFGLQLAPGSDLCRVMIDHFHFYIAYFNFV